MFGFFKGSKKKGTATSGKSSREDLIKQAMLNAQKAREEIGEENIQKMAAKLREQQDSLNTPKIRSPMDDYMDDLPENSEAVRARNEIRDMDAAIVAEHLRDLIDEDD